MKVFISHSSHDKKFAKTLKDDLKVNGFDTWFDQDEMKLGDNLTNKLNYAIAESSHFLVILSPEAVESAWVRYELKSLFENKLNTIIEKIIPIMYTACKMPDELKAILHADLSKVNRKVTGKRVKFISPGYDDVLNALCETLRQNQFKLTLEDQKFKLGQGELTSQKQIDGWSTLMHSGWDPKDLQIDYDLKELTTLSSTVKLAAVDQEFTVYLRIKTIANGRKWIGFGNVGETFHAANEFTQFIDSAGIDISIKFNLSNTLKIGFPDISNVLGKIDLIRFRASDTDKRPVFFSWLISESC
jgi:hypothetical protein